MQTTKAKYLTSVTLLIAAVTLLSTVFAVMTNAQDSELRNPSPSSQRQDPAERRAELEAQREQAAEEKAAREAEREAAKLERMETKETRLEEKKLEVCERHEAKINQHMDAIAERVDRQKDVFDKISERVQAFYSDKGLELATYEILVEDVNAKQAIVVQQISDLRAADVDFDCGGEDPIGVADAFKGVREEVSVAMQEYKTSIKNLISEIKPVAEASDDVVEEKPEEESEGEE